MPFDNEDIAPYVHEHSVGVTDLRMEDSITSLYSHNYYCEGLNSAN
jgi:hypothetical protein